MRRILPVSMLLLLACGGGDPVSSTPSNPRSPTPHPTTPGAPASIAIRTGNDQQGVPGTVVPVSPSIIVRDSGGLPVQGVAVTFSVLEGGGSVSGAATVTGSDGVATVGSWTLGPAEGTQQARGQRREPLTGRLQRDRDVPHAGAGGHHRRPRRRHHQLRQPGRSVEWTQPHDPRGRIRVRRTLAHRDARRSEGAGAAEPQDQRADRHREHRPGPRGFRDVPDDSRTHDGGLGDDGVCVGLHQRTTGRPDAGGPD